MSWRDDLRRVTITVGGKQRNLIGATFRGVAFFVDVSERAGGRRTVKHEFPLRDDPFVEDLGRRARTFRVDGYVLGDDYLSQRDSLLAALEDSEGPGELVHPYHGVRQAICDTVSVRESRVDGGYAQFSIEFSETPSSPPVPTQDVEPADQVSDSADAADVATDAELVEQYNPTGLPAFSLASAEGAVSGAAAGMKSLLGPIVSDTQELAALTGQIALITADVASLVRAPALILGKFRDTLNGLVNTIAAAPDVVLNALISAYSLNLGPTVVATTATRARELANQQALTAGLRRVFAVMAARLAPRVVFATIDDAVAARATLTTILDTEAGKAGDTAYPAIVDLRSHVGHAVPGGSNYARIVTVSRSIAIPSLLLTYQLYGAVDLESDVIARNDIRHPGFVFGTLKVLSSGG